jgi:hypothetical protein
MSSPSTSLATLRPDLGDSLLEYDLDAALDGFVATRVLPVFETATQSGPFGKFTLAALLQGVEDRRAPGAAYARIANQFTTDTFSCNEHGIEEVVDARESAMHANYFNAEVMAAARARFAVLQNLEARTAAKVFNATTWGSLKTTITNEWDDAANATPIADVYAARASVYAQCGMWPNAVILNRKVFNNATTCDSVLERIKYNGTYNPAERVTEAAMAQLFDVDQVIVGDASKNTAAEGQTVSIAPVWSDEYVMVARVATSQDIREPCIGRCLHWGLDGSTMGGAVETYDDPSVRGEVVRVRMDDDEKILFAEAGHLLDNATT